MGYRNNVFVTRHIETEKNTLKLHGKSQNNTFTKCSSLQIDYLAHFIHEEKIQKIYFGDTSQCKVTAYELGSKVHELAIEKLDLKPFDLGVYAGMPEHELRLKNLNLSKALESFRFRHTCFKDSSLIQVETAEKIGIELDYWFEKQGKSIAENSLLVLSNSLIVKVVNYLKGIMPIDSAYKNIGISNCGIIRIDQPFPSEKCWPHVEPVNLRSSMGDIRCSFFKAKLSPLNQYIVLIYPDVFGASKFGPCNLYNRVAREIANIGINVATFDSIGAGESPPVLRTLETEIESLDAVYSYFKKKYDIIICAHGLSANILFSRPWLHCVSTHLLAPLVNVNATAKGSKIDGSIEERHGMFYSDTIWSVEDIGKDKVDANSVVYFGKQDENIDFSDFCTGDSNCKIEFIETAGQNFSGPNVTEDLISKILENIKNTAWTNLAAMQ